jgi:uncharacterized membrane protein
MLSFITILKIAHLMGVIMGLGGAFIADALILTKAVRQPIEKHFIQTIKFLSHIVFTGLVLLWVTGIALAYEKMIATPEFFGSMKFWAKVTIVCVLTLNGVVVHNIVLKYIEKQEDKKLFSSDTRRYMLPFALVAAVSSVSWFIPLIMGKAGEWTYTYSYSTFIIGYLTAVLFVWAGAYCILKAIDLEPVIREIIETSKQALSSSGGGNSSEHFAFAEIQQEKAGLQPVPSSLYASQTKAPFKNTSAQFGMEHLYNHKTMGQPLQLNYSADQLFEKQNILEPGYKNTPPETAQIPDPIIVKRQDPITNPQKPLLSHLSEWENALKTECNSEDVLNSLKSDDFFPWDIPTHAGIQSEYHH